MIIAMFTAAAIVISYLESFIPVFIPGVKLGLANVIILIMIFEFKWYEALTTNLLRILIVSLIRGTFLEPIFYMSLAGGVASYLVMLGLSKIKIFTALGVSSLASITHSLAQLAIASLLISSEKVFYYLPFVALLSLLTGILSGLIADLYLKRSISNRFISVRAYDR